MTKVERRQGESFEGMLKRFRKKVSRARIKSAVRRKRHFVSKSEQKRIARRKAAQRERKRQRKRRQRYGY